MLFRSHQGSGEINWLYEFLMSRKRSRSRSRDRDSEEGLSTSWIEPQIGDPVLCFERKWAEMIVDGVKSLELRNYCLRKYKSGTRILIAANADKHQGRRAYPSPLGPEHNPRKGEILGSVCLSHQVNIYPAEFNTLFEFHRVEDREDAPAGRLIGDERVLRGWYFENAVKAPQTREYRWWTGDNKKGPQSWRKFHGWL